MNKGSCIFHAVLNPANYVATPVSKPQVLHLFQGALGWQPLLCAVSEAFAFPQKHKWQEEGYCLLLLLTSAFNSLCACNFLSAGWREWFLARVTCIPKQALRKSLSRQCLEIHHCLCFSWRNVCVSFIFSSSFILIAYSCLLSWTRTLHFTSSK